MAEEEAAPARRDTETRARAPRARRLLARALGLVLLAPLGVLGPEPARAGPNDIALTGVVWRDDIPDGVRAANEWGLSGITVTAFSPRGDVVSAVTNAAGAFAIPVDARRGPRWRLEVTYAPLVHRPTQFTGQNETSVFFADVPTNSTSNQFVGNVGLIDPRFAPAPAPCFSALVASSVPGAVYRFGPAVAPDNSPLQGTQLQPPPGQGAGQAFVPSAATLSQPYGMTYGPDGDLYVASSGTDRVLRYDGNTGGLKASITHGELRKPRGVVFGFDGRLYMTSFDQSKVLRYDPATGSVGQFLQPGAFNLGGGDRVQPNQGIAWLGGRLYVSAESAAGAPYPGRVMEFEANGNATGRSWILDAVPYGLRVGPDGLLYAAAGGVAAAGGIWRIDPTTNTHAKVVAQPGAADVSFGPDDRMYLVDLAAQKVRRYSWPVLGPLADYVPQPGAGYTHAQPRSLLWWRGTNPCANQVLPEEIADRVWYDIDRDGIQDPEEPGISTVRVELYRPGPDGVFNTGDDSMTASATTDWRGRYRFTGLVLGQRYQVRFRDGVVADGTPTLANVPGDPTDRRDSDVVAIGTVKAITFTYRDAEMHSYDAGFRLPPGSIAGTVWNDEDNDGALGNGESGVPWKFVEVVRAGTMVQSVRTDGTGRYRAFGLVNGDYVIRIPSSQTAGLTAWRSSTGAFGVPTGGPYEPAPDPDDNRARVDDGTMNLGTATIAALPLTLRAGTEPATDGDDANGNATVDFGLYQPSTIGDRVWSDDNGNGIQDNGEAAPLGAATIELRDTRRRVVQSVVAGADGLYAFPNLNPGRYSLRIVTGSGYTMTRRNAGRDDTLDSDADRDGETREFNLAGGVIDSTRDFGVLGVAIGDRVFDDENDDGVQQIGEVGVGGVVVQLLDGNGTAVASTTSAVDGSFRFKGIPDGTYRLRIPFLSLYGGTAVGYVSSVGAVAEHGPVVYEPPADPDNNIDTNDDGGLDWSTGDITTLPVTVQRGREPVADDGDDATNYTVDLGLFRPEGVPLSSYFANVVSDGPIAYWRLGDTGTSTAIDASGNNRHGTYRGVFTQGVAGGIPGDPDAAVEFPGTGTGNQVVADGLPVSTAAGARTTVEFWMRWNGATGGMPFGFDAYGVWFSNGRFGFNSSCGDVWGIDAAGLEDRWVHVVAVFTNGNTAANRLYIDGTAQALGGAIGCSRSVTSAAAISGWRTDPGHVLGGTIDEVAVYNGELPATRVQAHYTAATGQPPPAPRVFSIATHAGTGVNSNNGDGGTATAAAVARPWDVAAASDGTVYIAANGQIRKVAPSGLISTLGPVQGSWTQLALAPDGALWVLEYDTCRIRRMPPGGSANAPVIAGTGTCATSGDGGVASAAALNRPGHGAFDASGNFYFTEHRGNRVRRIAAGTSIITTVATGYSGPWGLTVDSNGVLYVTEWNGAQRVLRTDLTTATTIVIASGQGRPSDVAVDVNGSVYWTSHRHCVVRRQQLGLVSVVAGAARRCAWNGDGSPATNHRLANPTGIAVGPAGEVYLSDQGNYRIRRLS